MRVVAASMLYSSPSENSRALWSVLHAAHRRFALIPEYEQAFAAAEGAPFAVATSMARIGLFQVLQSLNLKPGDRILLSPVNIPEMLAVIEALRLRPLFVDFAPNSLMMDTADLAAKAPGARALFVTHVAGQIGDMQAWGEIADRFNLAFIQDATQANGCSFRGRPLATWCDFTIFSTCELKFIHTYRGGMVCVNDAEAHKRLRRTVSQVQAAQGTKALLQKWFFNAGAFTVLHPLLMGSIFHRFRDRIFTQDPLAEFNLPSGRMDSRTIFGNDYSRMREGPPSDMLYRASDFEAALGLRELRRMPARIERHRQIATEYRRALAGTGHLPEMAADAISSYWRFPLIFRSQEKAENFRQRMLDQGIIIERSGLSLLSKDVPRAREIIAQTWLLPCHAGLRDGEIERIARCARLALEPA